MHYEEIKELRKKHKISQEKLALALRIDQSYLSKIERGKVKLSDAYSKKLLNYFNSH